MTEESTPHVPLVSVCIPTYMRPDLLEGALQSVCRQDYERVEIVVRDDSPSETSVPVIASARAVSPFPIHYRRNVPKLGQNENVNALFADANGEYLILLHDDDLLLPGAITALMRPVIADPRVRVVFGKQNIIEADGTLLPEASRQLNIHFGRNRPSYAIDKPLEACLRCQFPNDSYLIHTALARSVGCRSEAEVGVRVDIDFSLRVGQVLAAGEMWFVDEFVASYRLSSDGISSSAKSRKIDHPVGSVALYRAVADLELPKSAEPARQFLFREYIDSMVKGLALQGDRLTALRLFASSAYGWRKRLSLKGVYHLALVLSPAFDRIRRY